MAFFVLLDLFLLHGSIEIKIKVDKTDRVNNSCLLLDKIFSFSDKKKTYCETRPLSIVTKKHALQVPLLKASQSRTLLKKFSKTAYLSIYLSS